MSFWPLSNPCRSGDHWLLHNAGCHVLQHLDFPWRGPGLGGGLLPSLPIAQHSLAGEGCAGTEGWRDLRCPLPDIVLLGSSFLFLLLGAPGLTPRS